MLFSLLKHYLDTDTVSQSVYCFTTFSLLLVLEVWDGKPSYRKSWAGNLFCVVGFDLGPLLQDQMRKAKVKSAYNLLIIGPRGLQCETNL